LSWNVSRSDAWKSTPWSSLLDVSSRREPLEEQKLGRIEHVFRRSTAGS
jgi:hypothetical protein